MLHWAEGGIRELALEDVGEHYGRYRLHLPEVERAMARSLERYGQISPLVVCLKDGHYELIDGFKRLAGARMISGMSRVSIRVILVDERGAKAAIYGLNRAGGKTRELEEAWIVYALVREDRLDAGRGRRAALASQELGMPPAGPDRAVGTRGQGRTARRPALPDGGAADCAVARGQPGGSSPGDPARGAIHRGAFRHGGSLAGVSGPAPAGVRPPEPSGGAGPEEGFCLAVSSRDPRLSQAPGTRSPNDWAI